MQIRPAKTEDAEQIAAIYNHYVINSHATFETRPIDKNEMSERMREGQSNQFPFFVFEDTVEILGYAYAQRFRSRHAYRHSVEVSVYVKNGHHGKKIGTRLYETLLQEICNGEIHAVIAGISLPNDTSVLLHENFGFQKVAHFREVGRKFDRWIDVGYWELLIVK